MTCPARRLIGFLIFGICCLHGVTRSARAGPTDSKLPIIPAHAGANFWTDGQPPGLRWPTDLADPAKRNNLVIWGSWCGNPICTGQLTLGPFKAPDHFSMVVAGTPSAESNALELLRMTDGSRIPIARDSTADAWLQVDVQLPADWVGSDVEIIASDRSAISWLALSEPFNLATDGTVKPVWRNRMAGPRWHRWFAHILGPLIGIILVLGTVGIAGYSILRRSVQSAPHLAPLLIAASTALFGYLIFWGYFAGLRFGQITAVVILLLAIIQFVRGLFTKDLISRDELNELKYPFVLLLIAALFYLGILWLPRSEGSPMAVRAACRATTWGLPSDNALQEWLATAMHAGKSPRSVNTAEWSSSDRPPLEAGVQLLSARVLVDLFHAPFNVNAQLTGMVLQLTWVYALWALLRALDCTPRVSAQIILCLIPTPLLYINSIYVWAKLSAGAFAIGMTVILCLRGNRPLTRGESAVAGVLFSLAILCHSGIAFYALPVLALWLVLPNRAGRPTGSCVLILIAASVAMFLPWSCYQKFFDPPGNHLIKLSFAGIIDSNSNSVTQTLRNAYGSLSRQTILANKISNFQTPFKGNFSTVFELFPADSARSRADNFFYLFRSNGLFLLGILAVPLLLLPRNRNQLRPVFFMLLVLTLAIIFWCLAMFGPGFTVIHQGAYGVPLVLLALLAYLLRMVHPIALQIAAVYNLIQFLWIYGWTFPYPPARDGLAMTIILMAGILSMAMLAVPAPARFIRGHFEPETQSIRQYPIQNPKITEKRKKGT